MPQELTQAQVISICFKAFYDRDITENEAQILIDVFGMPSLNFVRTDPSNAWSFEVLPASTAVSPTEMLCQHVRYNRRVYNDIRVFDIFRKEYGEKRFEIYGTVHLPVDQGQFVAIYRKDYWQVIDTL